jgi:CheY-like chemotaxis protein
LAGTDSDAQPGEPVVGGSEIVLIVEDDELVRNYVNTQLLSLGYVTRMAATGAEALALIDNDPHIEVLFTDVIMPGE